MDTDETLPFRSSLRHLLLLLLLLLLLPVPIVQ